MFNGRYMTQQEWKPVGRRIYRAIIRGKGFYRYYIVQMCRGNDYIWV